MSYKHCHPCDNFDICPCCEQETCQTCGESIDSDHMHLDEAASEKLDQLKEDEMLMPGRFCNECTFYAHHDINNPEQENYDDNLVYKVEEYVDGEREENFGVGGPIVRMKVRNWKTRIIIIGEKPKRTFPTIRGPFRLMPPKE